VFLEVKPDYDYLILTLNFSPSLCSVGLKPSPTWPRKYQIYWNIQGLAGATLVHHYSRESQEASVGLSGAQCLWVIAGCYWRWEIES